MILAIVERIENITDEKPFHIRYYLTKHFKDIFDSLGILLFPVISEKNLELVGQICDGLIITGSKLDIPPHYYNEEPLISKNYEVDEYTLDKALIKTFVSLGKPILGICGGLQSINVYFGGSLNQEIPGHNLKGKTHPIKIKGQTFLHNIYGANTFVNSFHKQAIARVANGFTVSATAPDGVVEAIEYKNIIAVQWHPEEMNDITFFRNFTERFLKPNNQSNSHHCPSIYYD